MQRPVGRGRFRLFAVTAFAGGTAYVLFHKEKPVAKPSGVMDMSVALLPLQPSAKTTQGSGVIWDQQGHVVTCAHVAKNSDFMVAFQGENVCLLEKVAEDVGEDIALFSCIDGLLSCKEPFAAREVMTSPLGIRAVSLNLYMSGFLTEFLSGGCCNILANSIDRVRLLVTTPRRFFGIGRLYAQPGFSGGGVVTEDGKSLGIYRLGAYIGGNRQWLGGYIRASHVHTVVNRMLVNRQPSVKETEN